jgi:hypothetical protein
MFINGFQVGTCEWDIRVFLLENYKSYIGNRWEEALEPSFFEDGVNVPCVSVFVFAASD